MRNNNQKGATLIKTLFIIVVIGTIVLCFMILLNKEREKSRDNIRMANIKQIQAAVEIFYSQNGSYPSTATIPAKENSLHNWLPNMDDHDIQNNFKLFLPQDLTAPLPADSSICRSNRICNDDPSSIANDFCYTAYPKGCSAAGEIKCDNFLLDFCIGGVIGRLNGGRHSVDRDGIR